MSHDDSFDVIGQPRRRVDGRAKVTGQTLFADDLVLPRMLHCKLLRSPYPHARIRSIDVSAAQALKGVKAVITRDDFADQPSEVVPAGEMMVDYRDVIRNLLAREKVLYDGHAVAAVAATIRVWFDCTPPIETKVSAPLLIASGTMYSSLRNLLPPNARPELQSSRLA